MTRVRNLLLDWSGTLVDDLVAVWAASNYCLDQAGLPPMSLEQFRIDFELPFERFYQRVAPKVAPDQLEKWFMYRFEQVQTQVTELPHARDFLLRARERNMRLFVISSIHPEHFATQSDRNGFRVLFEKCYTSVRDKRAAVADILRENSLDPAETLLVGDMAHDIEAARVGGIRSAAVLTGYQSLRQLKNARPDFVVQHLGELQQLLAPAPMAPPVTEPLSPKPTPTSTPTPTPKLEAGPAVLGRPIATVGALIFDDAGRVLLMRTNKWSNRWGIPGGKIEGGETCEQALRREVKEETGQDIADIRFVMVQDCIQPPEFHRPAHFLLLNYTCRAVGKKLVILNEEAQEFQWARTDDARRLSLNTPTRMLLDAVTSRPALARTE
ncbi:MAG: NUDIX domain-containing protein [Pedosphaera sp.]|nr:NUDIX domain-containing protein [Pedosphaera sp.]